MHRTYHLKERTQNQQGATLIVTLIFLLIITTLTVTSLQTGELEERMAGNFHNNNKAFQAAESTLRFAESDIKNRPGALDAVFGTVAGFYNMPGDNSKRWKTVTWSDPTAVQIYQADGLGGLAAPPAYIVENLNDSLSTVIAAYRTTTNSEIGGYNTAIPQYYRITARAVGSTDTSVVVLQSIYKR